jgi:hypothetical protein
MYQWLQLLKLIILVGLLTLFVMCLVVGAWIPKGDPHERWIVILALLCLVAVSLIIRFC